MLTPDREINYSRARFYNLGMKLEKFLSNVSPLHIVAEFANFLSQRDHSLQEILNHLVRIDLQILNLDSILFFQANDLSEFTLVAKSGIDVQSENELQSSYSLNDAWPVAYVIRHGKLLWLNEESQNIVKYPVLSDFPHLIGLKNLIVFPVFRDGVPDGAFALISRERTEQNSELEFFLTAIASIFSMYVYRNVLVSPDEQDDLNKKNTSIDTKHASNLNELTQRQLVIMRLISENRTNKNISENLGYSESTIRQEIMRIFAKTDCTDRHQVAEFYRNYSNKTVENSEI